MQQSAQLFLGLLKNQGCAFHAVVVLYHVFLNDQALFALADFVSTVQGALPPTLSCFEAVGYFLEMRSWIPACTASPT
jgi:hypothetical protein